MADLEDSVPLDKTQKASAASGASSSGMPVHEKPVVPEEMSKRAYKRQLKAERRAAERPAFIAKRAEKRREMRAAKRARKDTQLAAGAAGSSDARRPRLDNKPSTMQLILDCEFEDDLMKEGERVSLARQVVRAYAENRRAAQPVQLAVAGFTGPLRRIFDENMHGHWRQFRNIEFSELPLAEVLQQPQRQGRKTVYLSSDSDTELEELDESAVYIVGGIVDKGRHVNLCLNKAASLGLSTARLPISRFIKLSGRRVLTTSHVVELLSCWLELRDWGKAFEAVLPARKVLRPTSLNRPLAGSSVNGSSPTSSDT